MLNNLTLPQIIKRNYEQYGNKIAMSMKTRGIWHRFSWKDYYENIKCFSLGLIYLGLKPKDVVCIIGDNEPEWFWAEFAVQAAGGIATGIFVDSIPSEVKYIVSHSGAKFAIANDQEQTDKFLEIKNELPFLQKVIYWDPKGLKNYDDPILISYSEVIRLGKEYEVDHNGVFERNIERIKEDDPAFIYYTSGTTGLPKGAVVTHKSLINTARAFIEFYPLNEKDNLISNFPAAWVGDSFFATIPHLITRAILNFPEEPETIAQDTREVGPDFVIYGPRQWEGLVSDIQVKITDAGFLKRFFYKLFMPIGYRIADFKFEGKNISLFWYLFYKIAHFLLFRPLRDKLGLSKARFAVTGSSVLSLDTFRLINAMGIELRQIYASTEAGFISSHSEGENDFQSVGRPAINTEVRIGSDGELLVKSSSIFKEYFNEPEKTKTVVNNGWCHTGDAVYINENGHLIFLDRIEHMGELITGAKYAPQYIEGRLRFSPYIKDAMVIGGKTRQFISAIINIDFAMVSKWAEKNHIAFTTFTDLSQKEEVAKLIQKDLIRVNSYLPPDAGVVKFVLLHKEFDPDEAELTRTRKLRRDFIEQRYKELIEGIYNNADSVTVEAPVTYRDGRKAIVATQIKIRSVIDN